MFEDGIRVYLNCSYLVALIVSTVNFEMPLLQPPTPSCCWVRGSVFSPTLPRYIACLYKAREIFTLQASFMRLS